MAAVTVKVLSMFAPPAYAGGVIGPSTPSGNVYQITAGAIYNVASQDIGFLMNQGFSLVPSGAQSGIIAHSGGTAALAWPLVYGTNEIATVAAGTDSVKLPPAIPGAEVFIANDGANAAQVFGAANPWNSATVDTIDGTAGATGVVLTNKGAAVGRLLVRCAVLGAWISLDGGPSA